MNKWTLKFQNPSLENKYQQRQWDGNKILIIKVVAIVSMLLNAGKLISDQVQNNTIKIAYQAPLIIISFIILILLFRYPKQAYIFVLLLNYSFAIAQLWVDETYGSQRSYVLGSNMMASQMILMMTFNFHSTVPQLIIQCIFKIVVMEQQFDEHARILTVIHSIFVAICSVFAYYLICKASREQFLLSIKEDKFVLYLEKLLDSPFIFFEYTQDQFQPIFVSNSNKINRWDYNLCEGCNLRSLLRYIKIKTQTLEEYFLDEIQISKNQQELEAGINQFSFSFKGFSKIDVLESITDKRKIIIQFNNQYQKKVENNLEITKINYYYKLIKKVFTTLKKPQKYQTILFDLSIQFMSGFYLNCNKIVYYYPIRTLLNIIKYIDTASIVVQFDEYCEDFSLIGNKNKFSNYYHINKKK